MMSKVKGVWGMTNTSSLKLLEMEGDERAIVQLNDFEPKKVMVKYDREGSPYITYNRAKFYFSDCMRV